MMGEPKKYPSCTREKIRQRVREFRVKHAAEIRAEVEHKRLANLKQVGGNRFPTVYLYELVDELGQTFDVIISYESEPPAGAIRSPFLGSISMRQKLAKLVRRSRLKQIAEWRGNSESLS